MALTPTSSREGSGGGGGLYDAYAYVRDEATNGTDGGTTATGTWTTRPIDTEVSDASGIVSLSGNQFTLAAGTYLVEARAPALGNTAVSSLHRLRLRNITDGATVEVGGNLFIFNSGDQAHLSARFTIAGTKAFEIQHWTNDGRATVGMGAATSAGVVEVYCEVEIWREA